jgi:hypothetical protein
MTRSRTGHRLAAGVRSHRHHINPPGNESRAVDFLGAILTAEGIPWQSAERCGGATCGRGWGGDEPRDPAAAHRRGAGGSEVLTTEPLSGSCATATSGAAARWT